MNIYKLGIIMVLIMIYTFVIGQAFVQEGVVYYPENHSVGYDQVIYKSAYRIDELDFGIIEDLALRVYYPTDLEPEEKCPLVVLVHGGGFIGGTFVSFFDEAEKLASLGYVAVSVQYRLCQRNDCLIAAALTYPCNVSWAHSLVPSSYVAALDVQDAIKWLILHAEEFHIDKDRIAVGGHSAGAITALHTGFLDQDEVEEICSGCGTWPDYLGGELEDISGVRAVFSMSGAIYDTAWIDKQEAEIDLMAIHGTDDGVVYYGSNSVYPCCNTYQSVIHGACPMIHRQNELGGNSLLFTGTDFGHEVFELEWWPSIEEQILWFLGVSLFSDHEFQKQIELVRSQPVPNCPAPLQPVLPASLCNISLSGLNEVVFGMPNGVESLEFQEAFNVYPNPATEFLNITYPESKTGEVSYVDIRIYNLLGKLVLETRFDNPSKDLKVAVGELPEGMFKIYCSLKFTKGEMRFADKFMVVR